MRATVTLTGGTTFYRGQMHRRQ